MKDIKIAERKVSKKVEKELSHFSDLLKTLLINRDITTKEEADAFLLPVWERDVHDPFLVDDMQKAVDRILQAIEKEEKIVIYGDYDCDGIPGSTVLHDFFKKINYSNFSTYIPHRHIEGYGFSTDAVKQFAKEKVDLVITVDVGITDVESVALANKKGIDVIVTDHHLPIVEGGKEVLPEAHAILNSKKESCTYPDDMLCGAGVAFKLVQALLQAGKAQGKFEDVVDGWEKWLLDMAGVATVADMVPLRKENRALAHFGLKVLRKNRRIGLRRLLQSAGVAPEHITEDDIGFMIAPRINAASRMDHPIAAFELLAADDEAVAEEATAHLEKLNDKRKGYVAQMVKAARKKLKGREDSAVLVVGDTDWMPGVLGLLANKLVEEYGCPVFAWGAGENGDIKGSCRTDGSVSLMDLMRAAPADTFIQFGGHDASGGFTIKKSELHTLESVLSEVWQDLPKKDAEPLVVDAILPLDQVEWRTYDTIAKLAPFGMGNEKPHFLFENVSIEKVALFGKEKNHLRLEFLNSNGKTVTALGFFMTESSFPETTIERGQKVRLVATFEKSFWRRYPELRLRIVHLAPAQ